MFETSIVDGKRSRVGPPSFRLTILGVTSVFLVGAGLAMLAAHNDREVASRQQTAIGTVVTHEPGNHNRYSFRFHVDADEYGGWETPGYAERLIGESVTVYYDPLNPTDNSLTDFAVLADNREAMAVGAVCFWAILSGCAFVIERLLRKRVAPT